MQLEVVQEYKTGFLESFKIVHTYVTTLLYFFSWVVKTLNLIKDWKTSKSV